MARPRRCAHSRGVQERLRTDHGLGPMADTFELELLRTGHAVEGESGTCNLQWLMQMVVPAQRRGGTSEARRSLGT
jgi:hypothetical protein